MNKKILLFFIASALFSVQPTLQAESWWTTVTNWFTEKPVLAAASVTAAVGSLCAFKWYFSPEKVKQRHEAAVAESKRRIRTLYPSKIQPLVECYDIADRQYNDVTHKISKKQLAYNNAMRAKQDADPEANIQPFLAPTALRKEQRICLAAMHSTGQEIAELACTVAGNCRTKQTQKMNDMWHDIYFVRLGQAVNEDGVLPKFNTDVKQLSSYLRTFYTNTMQGVELQDGRAKGRALFDKKYAEGQKYWHFLRLV